MHNSARVWEWMGSSKEGGRRRVTGQGLGNHIVRSKLRRSIECFVRILEGGGLERTAIHLQNDAQQCYTTCIFFKKKEKGLVIFLLPPRTCKINESGKLGSSYNWFRADAGNIHRLCSTPMVRCQLNGRKRERMERRKEGKKERETTTHCGLEVLPCYHCSTQPSRQEQNTCLPQSRCLRCPTHCY